MDSGTVYCSGIKLIARENPFRLLPLVAQRPRPLSQSLTALPALPKGEPLAVHANFISLPRPLPLGEVDANVVSRRRGRGCSPQRLLPQEAGAANAACHYDPTREKGIAERPQTLRYPEIINNSSAEYAQSASGGHFQSSCPPGHPAARHAAHSTSFSALESFFRAASRRKAALLSAQRSR